jgi:hypothetical protein
MRAFDDFAPSPSVHIETHPEPGQIVHVLEVKVPEIPLLIGAGVRIVASRHTEEITMSLTGRLVEPVDDCA